MNEIHLRNISLLIKLLFKEVSFDNRYSCTFCAAHWSTHKKPKKKKKTSLFQNVV